MVKCSAHSLKVTSLILANDTFLTELYQVNSTGSDPLAHLLSALLGH